MNRGTNLSLISLQKKFFTVVYVVYFLLSSSIAHASSYRQNSFDEQLYHLRNSNGASLGVIAISLLDESTVQVTNSPNVPPSLSPSIETITSSTLQPTGVSRTTDLSPTSSPSQGEWSNGGGKGISSFQPTLSPHSGSDSNNNEKTNTVQKVGQFMLYLIFGIMGVIFFGFLVYNYIYIYYVIREIYYTFRQYGCTQWLVKRCKSCCGSCSKVIDNNGNGSNNAADNNMMHNRPIHSYTTNELNAMIFGGDLNDTNDGSKSSRGSFGILADMEDDNNLSQSLLDPPSIQ